VHVQCVGQEFADGRALTCCTDGPGIAGLEEQFIGAAACLCVAAEDGPKEIEDRSNAPGDMEPE
jgi:hypothetical protein